MHYVVGSQDAIYDYTLRSSEIYLTEDDAYASLSDEDRSFYEVYDLDLLYGADSEIWEEVVDYLDSKLNGILEFHVNTELDIYGIKVGTEVGTDIIYETVSGSLLEVVWSDDVEYIGLYESVYIENGELYDESGEHIQV